MATEKVSRRGVYYDLEISPYEYRSPYGDLFKFSSQKRLEIYSRDIVKELERMEKVIDRNNLREWIPDEIHDLIKRSIYKGFYDRVEG